MAAAILAGVVLTALGRAGEMAIFAGDTAPIELDEVSATDVALLRPPMSLWGYNVQATEDALRVIARSVTARDVEIATLRRELADLRGPAGSPAPPRAAQAGHAGTAHAAAPPGDQPRHAAPSAPAAPPGPAGRLPAWPQLPAPGHDD